jgi:short-subunit dehydrogenase
VHVIITGGSSGIGLEVARLYLRSGASVSLVARGIDRLEAARNDLERSVAGSRARIAIASADTHIEPELQKAFAFCEEVNGPCDILIASAGIVEPALFDQQAPDVFAAQIGTNLMGTVHAVRCVYPGMKGRRAGKIMIVASGAALIGIHGYSAYCASKSALVGFAEALRWEAETFGVGVSICFPPDTRTPQFDQERPKRSPQARRLMGAAPAWEADAVAAKIVRATVQGKAKLYFGLSLTALGWFGPLIKPVLIWWYGERRKH